MLRFYVASATVLSKILRCERAAVYIYILWQSASYNYIHRLLVIYNHIHSNHYTEVRLFIVKMAYILLLLGRCLQHRGGEPEQAKGADGMQLFALDCIAHIVGAETD